MSTERLPYTGRVRMPYAAAALRVQEQRLEPLVSRIEQAAHLADVLDGHADEQEECDVEAALVVVLEAVRRAAAARVQEAK